MTVRHRSDSAAAGLLFCPWLSSRLGWRPSELAHRRDALVGHVRAKRSDVAVTLEPIEAMQRAEQNPYCSTRPAPPSLAATSTAPRPPRPRDWAAMAIRHTARGWWQEEAEPGPELLPLEEDLAADVVVVGGGYTGMWAAWFVAELEPEARVVLLESDRCGAGPSGRNGGFVNAMWFGLPALRRRFGDEPALRLTWAAQEAVEGIGRWCTEQRVDAWYRAGGYLQVSTAPAHDGSWQAVADACAELGVSGACQPLSEAEVRARCDSPIFRAGAFYPRPPPSSRHAWRSGFARAFSSAGSPSSRARGSGG